MGAQRKPARDKAPACGEAAAADRGGGPISVHDYMQACLADARAGYYPTRQPIGKDGDFVTAPEISQVFGELIGVWAAAVWQAMGGPPAVVAELGPGRGTLMADALRVFGRVPGLRDRVTIALVETSPMPARDATRDVAILPCPAALVRGHRGGAAQARSLSSPTSSSTRCPSGSSCAPGRVARALRRARRRQAASASARERRGVSSAANVRCRDDRRRRDRRDAPGNGLCSPASPRGRRTRQSPRCSPITAMPRAVPATRCKRSGAIASPTPLPRRAKPTSRRMSISPR